jgi:hypothetical protein
VALAKKTLNSAERQAASQPNQAQAARQQTKQQEVPAEHSGLLTLEF